MMLASEAVEAVRSSRGREIIVATMSGVGFWPEAGPRDFRLLGLMGAAGSIGLGIAIAQPDQAVWVIDGDGSLMMQLGVLSAVADASPANFVHIVLDNRVYAVSGAQPVPAHQTFDWPAAAIAAGYVDARSCQTVPELKAELGTARAGPRLIAACCAPVRPQYPPGSFAFDASTEGSRVRAALARRTAGLPAD